MRVLCRETVVASLGATVKRLEAGKEYELPDEVASDLARVGFVQILDEFETATAPAPERAVSRRQRGTR